MRITADLHTHTSLSIGEGSILDNVTAAMARGLKAVAITDFRPQTSTGAGAFREFRQHRREISAFDRRSEGLVVLAGAECNIVSPRGALDLPDTVLSQIDILFAGLRPALLPRRGMEHFRLGVGTLLSRLSRRWERRSLVANTERLVTAIYTHPIDVITHPGYHLPVDMAELARACADRETALELSGRYREINIKHCRLAAREGVQFVLTSGARSSDEVGVFDRALAHARAIGLTPSQVLNSEEGNLFEWLQRRRLLRTDPSGWADWAGHPGAHAYAEEEARKPRRRTSYWTDWSEQGKVH